MARYKCGSEAMVGDVVRCENDGNLFSLNIGEEYVVHAISNANGYLHIGEFEYHPSRFTLIRRAADTVTDPVNKPSPDAARYELMVDGKPVRLESIIAACLSQERTGLTHADAGFLAHCWKYLFRMGLKSHAIHDARKLHDWTGKLVALMESEKTGSGWVDTTGHE